MATSAVAEPRKLDLKQRRAGQATGRSRLDLLTSVARAGARQRSPKSRQDVPMPRRRERRSSSRMLRRRCRERAPRVHASESVGRNRPTTRLPRERAQGRSRHLAKPAGELVRPRRGCARVPSALRFQQGSTRRHRSTAPAETISPRRSRRRRSSTVAICPGGLRAVGKDRFQSLCPHRSRKADRLFGRKPIGLDDAVAAPIRFGRRDRMSLLARQFADRAMMD